jgi:hypothetical protein
MQQNTTKYNKLQNAIENGKIDQNIKNIDV